MDSRTETYYAAFFDMFDTMGWQQLVREAKEQVEVLKEEALRAQTWEETLYKRGKMDQIQSFVDLQDGLETSYELQREEDKAVEEDANS